MNNKTWLYIGGGLVAVIVGVYAWAAIASTVSVFEFFGGGQLLDPIESAKTLARKWEGLVLHINIDIAGNAQIGYGHKIVSGDPDFSAGITEAQAEDLLDADMRAKWAAISQWLPAGLTSNQIAALLDFAFNEGVEALYTSTLLTDLNNGNIAGASAQLLAWDKAHVNGQVVTVQGLENRRLDEQKLFNT